MKKKTKNIILIVFALIIAFLLIALLMPRGGGNSLATSFFKRFWNTAHTQRRFASPQDSLAFYADSVARRARIADSLVRAREKWMAESLNSSLTDKEKRMADSLRRAAVALESNRLADSLAYVKAAEDSARSISDSLARVDSLRASDSLTRIAADPCSRDTLSPWVYTDPAGGMHYEPIHVQLFCTKDVCRIEWSIDTATGWKKYSGERIAVNATTPLLLRAEDTCGNRMPAREELYEFKPRDTVNSCPAGMEFVKVGTTVFCIDRYEWPNKKGAVPRAYISVYQAMDSCASVGKRLCTSDEWTIACMGPYGWKYPYGASYEPYACVTNDTTPRPSGLKPECRGYFGVFDMSGNAAEWTNTRSNRNKQFYNVMGGFWESGKQSACTDVRYSYYPQNRHNPVGFRCCAQSLTYGKHGEQ
jgi:hypothetical protein